MTTPAGTGGTIFEPTICVGGPTAAFPKRTDPKGTIPPGWRKFQNLAENIKVDFQNSQIAVRTKDNGVLFYMPGGDDEISLTAQTHSPNWQDMLWTTGMREAVAAAIREASGLTLSAGNTATTSVTVIVRLDTGTGVLTDFPVVIPAGQTAEQAAATIRATAFAGHVVGGSGASVTFLASTDGPRVNSAFVGAGSVAGTMTTVAEAAPKVTAGILDKSFKHYFRVFIEGFAQEGGLFPENQLVRFFGLKVTPAEEGGGGRGGGGGGRRRGGGGGGGRGGGGQADPGSVVMGYSGEGGNFSVALNIEFLSDPNAAAALSAAGYPTPLHDPAGRAVWLNHEVPAIAV